MEARAKQRNTKIIYSSFMEENVKLRASFKQLLTITKLNALLKLLEC